MKCWEGLGYYSRARNLKKSAKLIINKFNGKLPSNEEGLKSLPGVGDYTSKAIMAIAFNNKIIPLDGNVERVLKRVFYLKKEKEISKENLHKKKSFFGETNRASDYAQALMELGALICKPTKPNCDQCPISKYCKSYKKNDFEIVKINKFNKQKFFEANIFQNKRNNYYLLKNRKFNFLKDMPIFPMNEIPRVKFKNHIGKRINIKMSNMDMRIAITMKNNLPLNRNGFFVDVKDLSNLTLPSFTKKILNTIR
jgi:A/G-specific adenine glycosylase